jgi:hypothetical protein
MLIGLAAPLVINGLAQRELQRLVESNDGTVDYDCNLLYGASPWRVSLGGRIGEHFVGHLRLITLFDKDGVAFKDPQVVRRVLEQARAVRFSGILALDGRDVDADMLKQIGSLEGMHFLYVAGLAGDLSLLENMSHLRVLELPRAREITPAALESLSHLPALKRLRLNHSDIEGSSLAEFRKFPSLEMLDLRRTNVTWQDLAALADVPHLERVIIDSRLFYSEECGRVTASMPKIEFSMMSSEDE